ncbi:hypothetical protein GDO81_025358 [Engystomops pustulosus]|uniref:C2H2-type domain-containing protein n=1 Tax=Engystomops pustulosus TaxID=76066 RepID=A0AAV6ZH09_ENGPU|nr:hypothetical protein GDO81_025358 [Engystomops pustulosus]
MGDMTEKMYFRDELDLEGTHPADIAKNAIHMKAEPILYREGNLSDSDGGFFRGSYRTLPYTYVHIKEEPVSYDERADFTDQLQAPPTHIKKEQVSCDRGPSTDPNSPYRLPTVHTQYPFHRIKEESALCDEENLTGHYIYTSAAHYQQCPITDVKRDGYFGQALSLDDQQKSFSCRTRRTHYMTHQRIHAGEFSCPDRGKSFSQNSYFVAHQRIHTGERPSSCFKCSKSFRLKGSLNKHLRSHKLDNPYTCPMCRKSFIHKGHFVAHQRIHTEETRFSCTYCGKAFIHHGHLVAHQRIHTEEKKFSCPYCDKSFIHHGHFVAHQRVHTGEKPFPCPECGTCFSTHHNLVVHQRLHSSPAISFF